VRGIGLEPHAARLSTAHPSKRGGPVSRPPGEPLLIEQRKVARPA
jgi:hypothetical protein